MSSHAVSHALNRTHMIYTIAVIGFIFTLHLAIPIYSNSSFLALFADERTVGIIYMAGSAITIIGYLVAPTIVNMIGNYKSMLYFILAQAILYIFLLTSNSPFIVAAAFILQMAVGALMTLCLDIFLEVYTANHSVGTVRGLYTAALNSSWVIAPLIGSMLISGGDFRYTYFAALSMLFPLFYLVFKNFPRFRDPNYMHLSPGQLLHHLTHNRNWMWLLLANFCLQVFYAWMVIYSPVYLIKTIGLGWEQVGIIFTIMLLPFVLIQYPLGRLADTRYGEKEMMAMGFGIMALATIFLAFIQTNSVIVWAVALFVTRIGAAMAEIMLETYFFKTVSVRDSSALGLFRVTRPLAYFVAPMITGAALLFTQNRSLIFIWVAVMCILALIPVMQIRDTD